MGNFDGSMKIVRVTSNAGAHALASQLRALASSFGWQRCFEILEDVSDSLAKLQSQFLLNMQPQKCRQPKCKCESLTGYKDHSEGHDLISPGPSHKNENNPSLKRENSPSLNCKHNDCLHLHSKADVYDGPCKDSFFLFFGLPGTFCSCV